MKSSYQTSPNIAIVKYWGLKSEKLNIPANGSISFTLGKNLRTATTVEFSSSFKEDSAALNGKKLEGKGLEEISRQLDALRSLAGSRLKAKIISENNFPTGAGIASSASGFAAITLASASALGLKLPARKLSSLARLVSGSASRSIYGGFVELKKGRKKDGSDSFSIQLAPESHWPELRDAILIVSEGHKKVSSREGMRLTVKTNPHFPARAKRAEKRLSLVRRAILKKDAESLFLLAMEESDDLHKTIEGTRPKIEYLNKTSRKIMGAVRKLNSNSIICGYTFDAGPNAHILTLEKNLPLVLSALTKIPGVKKHFVSGVGPGPKKLG